MTKIVDGERVQLKVDSCRQGEGFRQIRMATLKKNDFHFCIIIWKYFLSNINLIFEYSVLDKIKLDCKVYPKVCCITCFHVKNIVL